MTKAQSDTLLELTKCDLRILHQHDDRYIKAKIQEAVDRMDTEGARYDLKKTADLSFIASLAAWLYKARDSDKGYPRWLRYEMNNRCIKGVCNG